MDNKFLNVTGLWAKKDKNGQSYMVGSLGPSISVLIFKNKNKEDEKHPDYIMYFAPKEKKEKSASEELGF